MRKVAVGEFASSQKTQFAVRRKNERNARTNSGLNITIDVIFSMFVRRHDVHSASVKTFLQPIALRLQRTKRKIDRMNRLHASPAGRCQEDIDRSVCLEFDDLQTFHDVKPSVWGLAPSAASILSSWQNSDCKSRENRRRISSNLTSTDPCILPPLSIAAAFPSPILSRISEIDSAVRLQALEGRRSRRRNHNGGADGGETLQRGI